MSATYKRRGRVAIVAIQILLRKQSILEQSFRIRLEGGEKALRIRVRLVSRLEPIINGSVWIEPRIYRRPMISARNLMSSLLTRLLSNVVRLINAIGYVGEHVKMKDWIRIRLIHPHYAISTRSAQCMAYTEVTIPF